MAETGVTPADVELDASARDLRERSPAPGAALPEATVEFVDGSILDGVNPLAVLAARAGARCRSSPLEWTGLQTAARTELQAVL